MKLHAKSYYAWNNIGLLHMSKTKILTVHKNMWELITACMYVWKEKVGEEKDYDRDKEKKKIQEKLFDL